MKKLFDGRIAPDLFDTDTNGCGWKIGEKADDGSIFLGFVRTFAPGYDKKNYRGYLWGLPNDQQGWTIEFCTMSEDKVLYLHLKNVLKVYPNIKNFYFINYRNKTKISRS